MWIAARFNIYQTMDENDKTVVMLESVEKKGWVVAIDKVNDTVIAKVRNNKNIWFQTSLV